MCNGKVWLVGAGPSDTGLMTVKAVEVLKEAEVVVYDALIGESIRMMIPDEAEKIDVGKRAGNHTMVQEDINRLLYEKAAAGKKVVRLKGGDPFLFGRGGEELELLAENNIEFEVVPGVTSAISVPAYNGIPVTHRDCASSVHIITGHKKKGCRLDIDFEALVRAGGTLVFLMGVAALPDIMNGLIAGGMDPDMPAAILQKGTSAEQKKIVATASTLENEVRKQGIEPPAIIVVGRVCLYGNEFSWYEKLPLFGEKIIVTRPKNRISTISDKLRKLGAQVIEAPMIKTVPVEESIELDKAIEALDSYSYLVFTSPAGVEYFFKRLNAMRKDIRAFGNGKIAVIGQGSRKELEKYGIIADMMPEIYDAKHLGIMIGERCNSGDRILIPRARIGSKELIEEITKKKDVIIDDIPLYDTEYEEKNILDINAELTASNRSLTAVFTSASTVRGFKAMAGDTDLSEVTALCIGRQTQTEAKRIGMITYTAEKATIDSLVELAVRVHDIKTKEEK